MTTTPVPSARLAHAEAHDLPFLKVEGLGNDFLLIDLLRPAEGPRPAHPLQAPPLPSRRAALFVYI